MNTKQIQLVRDSSALFAPIAPLAANLFYARLFELDPSLRPMFPDDLREQKKSTSETIIAQGAFGLGLPL